MSKPSWLNQEITSESLPSDTDIAAAGDYIITQINKLLGDVKANLNTTNQGNMDKVIQEKTELATKNEKLLALLNAAKVELEKLSRSSLASDNNTIIKGDKK